MNKIISKVTDLLPQIITLTVIMSAFIVFLTFFNNTMTKGQEAAAKFSETSLTMYDGELTNGAALIALIQDTVKTEGVEIVVRTGTASTSYLKTVSSTVGAASVTAANTAGLTMPTTAPATATSYSSMTPKTDAKYISKNASYMGYVYRDANNEIRAIVFKIQ